MREAAAITNTERTTSAHAILLVSAVASGKRLTDRRRQTRSLANSLHFHQRKRPAHERNHLSAEYAYGLAFSEQVYRHGGESAAVAEIEFALKIQGSAIRCYKLNVENGGIAGALRGIIILQIDTLATITLTATTDVDDDPFIEAPPAALDRLGFERLDFESYGRNCAGNGHE